MPPLQSIRFGIKCVEWSIPHFHTLRVNLNALVDILQCIVPTITEIFPVGLGLPRACKTQLLICPRLESSVISSPIMNEVMLTASGTLVLPASFRQIANTAALSIA